MAVLRAPEPVVTRAGGVPAALLDHDAPCWHSGAGDWAPGFIAAADEWAVKAGIVLPGGEPDWRRLRAEFGIQRPRRLRRWPS